MCRESIRSICLPPCPRLGVQGSGRVAPGWGRVSAGLASVFPFSSPRAPQRHNVPREVKVRGVPAPSVLPPPPRRSVESPDTGQEAEDQVQTLD